MFVAKRLCGDKSDNIRPVFAKCGKKTANTLSQLVDDTGNTTVLFAELRKKGGDSAVEQYEKNDLLMNFGRIPSELKEGFIRAYSDRFM